MSGSAEREVDVVVVGAGVAGLTVATRLADVCRVLVLSQGDGSTRLAQGGVAAAVGPGDSPEQHAEDTLRAGAGACDADAVRALTQDGPHRVADLAALGATFDQEDGRPVLGREGGHSRRRILHASGDATGAEVARVLELRARELDVPWLDARVTGLLSSGGQVVGVEAASAQGPVRVRARATVLATGGIGHAYETTTNPLGVTGDGLALALLAGATVADVEFVQFHPTALWTGATHGQVPLVTEALRGEGAVLRDSAGRAFMAERHPLADLAPRDVVARCVHEALRRDGQPHVWLDTAAVDGLERRFPTVAAACRARAVDPAMIPVAPAEHYLCGGVVTDRDGATDVEGLYAVGEVAATGVHGANRLASNSLLEGLVYGHRLAAALAAALPPERPGEPELRSVAPATGESDAARALLSTAGGLVREADALAEAHRTLLERPTTEVTWLVATAVLGAAEVRRESRGCHLRADAPRARAWWNRRIVVRLDDAGLPRATGEPQERAA